MGSAPYFFWAGCWSASHCSFIGQFLVLLEGRPPVRFGVQYG